MVEKTDNNETETKHETPPDKTQRQDPEHSAVAHRVVGRVTATARSVGGFLWRRKLGIAIGIAIAIIPLPVPRTWAAKLHMVPK